MTAPLTVGYLIERHEQISELPDDAVLHSPTGGGTWLLLVRHDSPDEHFEAYVESGSSELTYDGWYRAHNIFTEHEQITFVRVGLQVDGFDR